jgi:hypothetical protein
VKLRQTKELKVANTIATMVNDLTLDLDQVGLYLATSNNITYRRIIEIAEAARYEKEEQWKENQDANYLF